MNQRLRNLYTHLIDSRKHELQGWYDEYRKFAGEIRKIRENLESTNDLRVKETYFGTSFGEDESSFDRFVKKLLYDKSNGVASRGQSVLSLDNLNKFIRLDDFPDRIESLIVSPSLESYNKFNDWWKKQNIGDNPVLINRAVAAFTTNVSTTVDVGKFDQVFHWLQKEKLIDSYDQSDSQDWFSKNEHVISQISTRLPSGTDSRWIGLFVWELYENISNPFSLKKQIIKYGSPGTGKTFKATQNSKMCFKIWNEQFLPSKPVDFEDYIEIVQFHPSYTYEDFLEGLRPKLNREGQSQLVLQNGVFKEFCKKAARWENDIFDITGKDQGWEGLTVKDIIKYKENLTGDHWKFIFDIEDKSKKIADAVPPYFFIIDEINRAELSRVFGELMYCLEYRGVGGSIKTQYSHLNDEDTGMIKRGNSYQFYIPNNIYLIGTMNTIDRSVESFDFALRRRFRWEEVLPDTVLLHYHLSTHNSKWVGLAKDLENLNLSIESEPLLGRDFQIGHAYLWNLPYSKDLTLSDVRKVIWEDSIMPLLQEYIRGSGREDLLKIFENKFGIR